MCLVDVPKLEIYPSGSVCRYRDVADANMVEAGGLAKRRLSTRIRGLKYVSRSTLGDTNSLRRECGDLERVYALFSPKPLAAADVAERARAVGRGGAARIRATPRMVLPETVAQVSVLFEKEVP